MARPPIKFLVQPTDVSPNETTRGITGPAAGDKAELVAGVVIADAVGEEGGLEASFPRTCGDATMKLAQSGLVVSLPARAGMLRRCCRRVA